MNDVIKSESHDNIFSTPKFGSELKRRASDVSLQSISNRPASLNLNYSQRGAPGKEKSKKAKPVKTKTYKFHEFKVNSVNQFMYLLRNQTNCLPSRKFFLAFPYCDTVCN